MSVSNGIGFTITRLEKWQKITTYFLSRWKGNFPWIERLRLLPATRPDGASADCAMDGIAIRPS
nr:hypothetical protein [Sporomusa silvacetica]